MLDGSFLAREKVILKFIKAKKNKIAKTMLKINNKVEKLKLLILLLI